MYLVSVKLLIKKVSKMVIVSPSANADIYIFNFIQLACITVFAIVIYRS